MLSVCQKNIKNGKNLTQNKVYRAIEMKYLYYCNGEIINSYIGAVNNKLVRKLKEDYKGNVKFNYVPREGITSYMIRAELDIKSKDILLEIQNSIRYDEIKLGVKYKKWSKVR